jgi:heme/copper-type cytochrome/quinol oxidase subunit 2
VYFRYCAYCAVTALQNPRAHDERPSDRAAMIVIVIVIVVFVIVMVIMIVIETRLKTGRSWSRPSYIILISIIQ